MDGEMWLRSLSREVIQPHRRLVRMKIRTRKVIYKKTTKIIFPTLMVLVKLNLEDSWDGLKLNLGPSQN